MRPGSGPAVRGPAAVSELAVRAAPAAVSELTAGG